MTKILIIEDDRPLRSQIVDLLQFSKYETLEADDGRIGLNIARMHHPDLIICDIMMPNMDGYEVLTELHSLPETAAIPFIFLTAMDTRNDARRGMKLGADDYLTKPFRPNELVEAVEAQLQKRARLVEEFEARMEMLRTNITNTLPHEISTSIDSISRCIKTLSEMTQQQPLISSDRVSNILKIIDRSLNRLSRVAENYLLFARLESIATDDRRKSELHKNFTFKPSLAIYSAAWNKVTEYHRQSDFEAKLIDVPVGIADDSLAKIITELIDNALRFSDPGKPVRLITRQLENNDYEITIRDQGRGMNPQEITSLGAYIRFETTLYGRSGTGLGLAIVKRMTDIYNGTLTINSEPGQGTEVIVTLPGNRKK